MHPYTIAVCVWIVLGCVGFLIAAERENTREKKKWAALKKCANCEGSGIDPVEPEHGCNSCDGTGLPLNRD